MAQPATDQATDQRPAGRTSKRGGPGTGGPSRRIVLAAGRRARGAAIDVTEGGETFRLGRGEPMARVTVHDRRAYGALLRSGSVGLGTSYVAGWWDTDDLTGLVRALSRDTRPLRERLDRLGRAWGAVLDVPARLATPGRDDDKRNIAEHYDLSNDFFALMLDETMTYSCAVFERPGATLAEAQEAKIDRLCTKLELAPTDHLVEIGSGWGGLAVHAATRYGCRVTTTTISDAQRTYVEKRVADAGLSDRITVLGLGLAGPHRPVRQAGVGRDGRGGGLALARPVSGQVLPICWPMTGWPPSRPSSSTTAASSGPNATRTSCAAWSSPAGASPRWPRSPPAWPGLPTCASWTWRTSAATTPRHCDAGRTTWPATPTRWRPSGWAGVPPSLGPLSRLLRGFVPRTPHQRRPARPGQARPRPDDWRRDPD